MTRTFDALDEEWAALVRSQEAAEALNRWSRCSPILARAEDLADVLRRRRNPAMAREILAALAEMAPSDSVAARTLLQALLPGLLCLAGTAGSGDRSAPEEMVGFAWERIRTYPSTRSGSVAGNVLLDVRKDYRRYKQAEITGDVAPRDDRFRAAGPCPEDAVIGSLTLHELMDQLSAAEQLGLISADARRVIIRTRVGGETLREVAVDSDVPPRVLKLRRWRAEQKLRRELPLAS